MFGQTDLTMLKICIKKRRILRRRIEMKKIFLLLTVVVLAFPGFVKTQQVYEFKTISHGPLGDNLGTPMTVCAMPDGSVAVFDASTTSIAFFDKTGKLTKKTRIKIDSFTSSTIPADIQFGGFVQPISFDSDDEGNLFILSVKNLGKLMPDGSTSPLIDFASLSPSLTSPVMVHILKNKIYILDQKLGVAVFDASGKYEKTIGQQGTGSGKFNSPVNFWVGIDGSVVILDSRSFADLEEDESTEMLLLMYDHSGNLVKEFGPSATGMQTEDYTLTTPWVGTMTRTAIYLVDISFKDYQLSWIIKQFNLDGDFIKIWPIIADDKLEQPGIIKDVILSMDSGSDDSVYFTMPFAGKLYSDPSAFRKVGDSKPQTEGIKLPSSAITSPSGNTYILDIFPPMIHQYDSTGKLVNRKEIKDNFSILPGLDLSFGIDMAYAKGEIVVSTGMHVIKIDEKSLGITGETDLSSSSMDFSVFHSIAWKDGFLAAIDSSGQVSVSSGGIPITFDAMKDMGAKKLTDIAFDKNGSILVLDPVIKKIGMYTTSGSFVGKVDISSTIESPSSFCCLPTGEIVILDAQSSNMNLVASNGSVISSFGKLGPISSTATREDYAANPGEFYLPTHITSNSDGILTIVDFGNCRVQTAKNATPAPPEKTPAKLSVSHSKIDFGKVYYENEGASVQIEIKNLGETDMSGLIKTNTGSIKVTPKIITPETKTVTVTLVPEKSMAWRPFSDKLSIETNGGNTELPITANIVGKVIKMTIGSTSFQVTTDKQETVISPRSPEIVSGRTYVPLRATGDIFKAGINWDTATKKVTFTMDGKTIELWIGRNVATVDGQEVPLSSPPIILNSSTYVPIRFVSEQMGANVEWDGQAKTVTITYPKP